MTIIICHLKDCLFNHRKTHRCKCDALGVKAHNYSLYGEVPVCDSYYPTPQELEKYISLKESKNDKIQGGSHGRLLQHE